MSDLELKPRPFCGHELDELDVQMSIFGPRVHCWYCGAIGPNPFPRLIDSEDKTYEQMLSITKAWWNKRAGDGDD